MSDVKNLELSPREKSGSNASHAIRKAGGIPVVLYGHGKETVSLEANGAALKSILAQHTQFLELTVGGKIETALIRDVQYDTYGLDVLHVDFVRVDVDEAIEVSIPVVLRGQPKGAAAGGILETFLTEILVSVAPKNIPESIEVSVAELEVGESILVKDLELPPKVELVTDVEKAICGVVMQKEEAEESEALEGAEDTAEPEVVGQAPDGGDTPGEEGPKES